MHLADFPVADKTKINKQLSEDTRLVMKISSLGRAFRSKAGIKVRQPLAKAVFKVASRREQERLEKLKHQILDELNVKEIVFVDSMTELEKPASEEIVRRTSRDAIIRPPTAEAFVSGKAPVVVTDGDYGASGPTEISPELASEGMAREIVHRLQTMRRSAGFDIADHIITYYEGDEYMRQVMESFADYIKQETLSRELNSGVPSEDVFTESYKLSGHDILLGVRRLD
ncbi:Isoleucine--tRNA ligase [subsurface metagenome]